MIWLFGGGLLTYVIYTCWEKPLTRSLELARDGAVILQSAGRNEALALLPEGYEFLDYRYTIRGCSLSTFHRDVTSSPFEFQTSHPVYTLISYHSPGTVLGVVPGSHITAPYTWGRPWLISSKECIAVLFHCDLLHAGAMTRNPERHAVQYKIAHKDDLTRLQALQGIDKEVHAENKVSRLYEYLCRKISLLFPWFFNHKMTRYLQQNDGSLLNRFVLLVFGRAFYNR